MHSKARTKLYCTAPWVESHLFNDGQLRPCDHNQESLGNWQEQGLASAWNSPRYQEFRETIAKGEFPNAQCRACYLNNSASTLGVHLGRYFWPLAEQVQQLLGREVPELGALVALFKKPEHDWKNWSAAFDNFFALSPTLKAEAGTVGKILPASISRLERLLEITKSYFHGEKSPPHVAAVRQVRLINKCNARCIMCAGMFNGDIVNGPGMDDSFLPEALYDADHLISFASETSEFLLYKNWKTVVAKLCEHGMPKLKVFTNGILLTPENVRYLVDHDALETLHVSMNGASREIHETNQINVKFDRLLENIRYMFAYASEKKASFQPAFSFIIMRRNYHQMAEFVRLVHGLSKGSTILPPVVYFAYLESNNDMENYREFLFREHHALVDPDTLHASFLETHKVAKELGVYVTFCEGPLDEFIRHNRRPPKLVCKDMDLPVLHKYLEQGGSPAILSSLVPASQEVEHKLAAIASSRA